MKFITRIFLILAITLVLSACGKSSEDKATYVLDKDGQKATVSLNHKGDDVTKLEVDALIDYEKLGIPTEMKNQFEQGINLASSAIKAIKGVDFSIDFKEKQAGIKFSVDYLSVDMNQLKGLGELAGTTLPVGELEKMKSLKTVEAELLKAGFKKK